MVTSAAVTKLLVTVHPRRLKTSHTAEAGPASEILRGFKICIYFKGEYNF